MITLYSVPVALYCAKLRILMRHKALQWEELPPPGGYGSEEYRAIVPSGNLPAMFHDDLMLADSEAIAEYLEEAFPSVPMMPSTVQLRAKAREKSRLHDTRLEPSVRAIYPQVAYETRDEVQVKAGGQAVSRHLAALDLLLKTDPLDRDTLWLCDCGFAVTFAWIEAFEKALSLPVEWPDGVTAYRGRLLEFQAVSQELRAYAPAMETYLQKAYPPQT